MWQEAALRLQPRLQEVLEVDVVDAPRAVEVDRAEREVAREKQRLRGLDAAVLNPEAGRSGAGVILRTSWGVGQDAQRVDEAVMVEPAVRHPRVERVAEQVVHAVRAEDVAADDFPDDGAPR